MGQSVIIRVDHVSKFYSVRGTSDIHALDNINFDIYKNEFLAMIGASGCGKSTLLNIIAGTLEPTSGCVYYHGKKVTGTETNRGFVFQEDAVFPWFDVRKNVEYGPRRQNLKAEEIREITDRSLELVGLKKYEKLWPKELSGGMRKRVDLARALANDPEILLMDEPFGSLDVITKQNLQVEIEKLYTKLKKTFFFVTHDLEEAIFLADRVIIVTPSPGKIKTTIKIEFERPRSSSIKTSMEFQKLREELGSFVTVEQ